eukprot:1517760-Rhodomonas_salina.1
MDIFNGHSATQWPPNTYADSLTQSTHPSTNADLFTQHTLHQQPKTTPQAQQFRTFANVLTHADPKSTQQPYAGNPLKR